jgi:hypothetical protein
MDTIEGARFIGVHNRMERLEADLKQAFACMSIASCLPGVRDEYDFEPVLAQLRRTLSARFDKEGMAWVYAGVTVPVRAAEETKP